MALDPEVAVEASVADGFGQVHFVETLVAGDVGNGSGCPPWACQDG